MMASKPVQPKEELKQEILSKKERCIKTLILIDAAASMGELL
jgi:Mg-chelatase subunit ChlD